MRTDVTWKHEVFICFPRALGGLVTNPCARKLFPLITSTRSFMPIVRTNVHAGHTHFNSTYIPPHTPFVYIFHSWCTWKHLSHAVVSRVSRYTHANIISLFFKCFICLCEFECKYSFISTFLFSFVYLQVITSSSYCKKKKMIFYKDDFIIVLYKKYFFFFQNFKSIIYSKL